MSMLSSAQIAIERSAKQIGLNDEQITSLLKPDNEHQYELTVNGKKHQAYRIQHSNKRGPYKGGVRFHHQVDLDEVRALALLMSIKTAAVGIPMGGGKGGVVIDTRQHEKTHLEAVARAYVQSFQPHIGPDVDVPAPDVNTNAEIIDWMTDEYQKLTDDTTKASFTGKSLHNGGSEGREAATGRGGVIVLREYLKTLGRDPKIITVAVQGAGNVGFWFARLAETELGVKVVAMADSKKTVQSSTGLGISKAKDYQKGWINSLNVEAETPSEQVIALQADVLVLAALEDSVTNTNVDRVQAGIVLELANGPISDESAQVLNHKNIAVLPDVVANAGGVIVSYLEWLQNKAGEHWSEQKVNQKLEHILVPATKTMIERAQNTHISLKDAAFQIALEELTK